jgi:hypothetical protein
MRWLIVYYFAFDKVNIIIINKFYFQIILHKSYEL